MPELLFAVLLGIELAVERLFLVLVLVVPVVVLVDHHILRLVAMMPVEMLEKQARKLNQQFSKGSLLNYINTNNW